MTRRRLSRRDLFAAAGRGTLDGPTATATAVTSSSTAPDDLPRGAELARRALAALEATRGTVFRLGPEGARLELGAAGLLRVERTGPEAARVTLTCAEGEIEILRPLRGPGVGRVRIRFEESGGPRAELCYDTLRRIPAGVEMTFSSEIALRHLPPLRRKGDLPAIYETLAGRAIDGAGRLLESLQSA